MLKKLQNEIENLTKEIPNWDIIVDNALNHEQTNDEEMQKGVLDRFTELLNTIVKQANEKNIPMNDVLSLFKDYKCSQFVSVFIKRKMKLFGGFKALRDLEQKDLFKAKYCIDLIWSSYVVRFDPYLDIPSQSPISNEEDFVSVASSLDSFADMCVVRQLSASAICKELKEETGLSDDLSHYITDKIDKDFEKIKMNYIVDNLDSQ